MVRPAGLEPATCGFGEYAGRFDVLLGYSRYSNELQSYSVLKPRGFPTDHRAAHPIMVEKSQQLRLAVVTTGVYYCDKILYPVKTPVVTMYSTESMKGITAENRKLLEQLH